MATHRENLNKRKLDDEDIECDTKKPKQKEDKRAKKKVSHDKPVAVLQDEDEDEIFVCTKKTQVSVRKTTIQRKRTSRKCATKAPRSETDCDKDDKSEESETPKCVQDSGDDGDRVLFAENENSVCSEEAAHTAPELNSDVESLDISVTRSIDIACEKKGKW